MFILFQEGSGEGVEYFWRKIKEKNLPFNRNNKLTKIFKRKRIINDLEYDFITDVMMPYYQEGLTMFDITRCFGWDTTLAKLIQIKTSNYCIVLQELPPNFCVCFWLCTSANMAPNWPLLVCIGVRSIVKWYGLHLRFKIVQCHVQKIRFLLSAVLFLKLRLKKIRMSNIARADRYGNGQTHVFFKTLYLLNLGRLWPKHSLLSNNHICSMF